MRHPAAISDTDARVILNALMAFCQGAGKVCYGSYTPEVLRDYIEFHLQHDTLAWVREGDITVPGGWRVTGLAVAWQGEPTEWFQALHQTRCAFAWKPHQPDGRALFIADVVATTPEAVAALLNSLHTRFPGWNKLPIYTVRRGRLVLVPARQLLRLWRSSINKQKKG